MLLVGTIAALAIRLIVPWKGAWIADCDLDLGADQSLPSGAVNLTIGSTTLKGTVDARATARMGDKARARIVAGAGAWGNVVPKQDFHNDAPAGVSSTMVYRATASKIGETVNDPSPVGFGTYFERLEGRASSVFDAAAGQPARDWYVDANGVTRVQSWPTIDLGADALVHAYDAEMRIAHVSADEIVWPGTTITDARFGTIVARDIDQRFTAAGSRVDVYHSAAALGRLDGALETLIRAFAGTEYAETYEYRIVKTNSDGRLQLQSARKTDGVPDTLPIPVWPGLPGMSATFSGAQIGLSVRVAFLGGDKTRPLVVGFDGRAATTMTLDIATLLSLGAGASSYVALASLVGNELTKIAAAFAAATAPSGGGTVTYGASGYTTPGSVAAQKVKAE